MRPQLVKLLLVTLGVGIDTPNVLGQELYYRAGNRRVELREVKDVAAARVLWNAIVSKAQRRFEQFFGTVRIVGLEREELLLQKAGASFDDAAAALRRYVNIQEMQRLRVFQTPGSKRLLVEFPELIVQFKPGVSPSAAEAHIRLYSNTYQRAQVSGLYYVRVGNPNSTLLLAEQFWGSTKVDYCEPRFRVVVPSGSTAALNSPASLPPAGTSSPNDALFDHQWALVAGSGSTRADIRIQGAWKRTQGDTSIRVAVLDDGVDTTHPDLSNRTEASWDVITHKSEMKLEPAAVHGTAVAGIIAAVANNQLGIAGIAPSVHLLAIRIASRDSQERWTSDAGWMAEGIDKGVELGARILNGSWGVDESENVRRAVLRALNPDSGRRPAVLVFSAGNDGEDVQFPASMAKGLPVIAVGASTNCNSLKTAFSCDGDPSWASNLGDALTLIAPGTGIATLRRSVDSSGSNPNNYVLNFSGTSAAAPFVSAAAALLLSQDGALTPAEVKERLRLTGDKVVSGGVSYFRLNACRALGGSACD